MRNNILFTVCLLFVLYITKAQTASPSFIGSGGQYFEAGNVQAGCSLGEFAITTLESGVILNQGFQQFLGSDETIPVVNITSPNDGSNVSGTVGILATITDVNLIAKAEFYIDDVYKTVDYSLPYAYNWSTATYTAGNHEIKVVGYDVSGNKGRDSINVTIITSVDENNSKNNYLIYPNPCDEVLNFTAVCDNSQTLQIELLNYLGKCEMRIQKEVSSNFSSTVQLNTSGLSKGFYMLKITNNKNEVVNYKICKY